MRIVSAILCAILAACGDGTIKLEPGVYGGVSQYVRDTCQLYKPGHTQYTTLTWLGNGADGYACSPIDDGEWVCERSEPPAGECRIDAFGTLTITPISETSAETHQIVVLRSNVCSMYCEIDIRTSLSKIH